MTAIQLENYDLKIAPQYDASGLITSGMVLGDTLRQNQGIILSMHQGEIKDVPAQGVGIADMLLDEDYTGWSNKVREAMQMDGQKVSNVIVNKNGITIESNYES